MRQVVNSKTEPRKDVAQASEAEQISQDKGEKWSPLNDSEDEAEDIQHHKDKVFSEYLDTVKAESALKSSDEKQSIDYNALRDSEKSNLQGEGRNYREYSKLPPQLREYGKAVGAYQEIQEARKQGKYLSLRRKQGEEPQHELSEDEQALADLFKSTNLKHRKDVLAELQKQESKLRDDNEKFMYRYNYSKDHPEAQQPVEFEESVDFKMMKQFTDSPKEFDESVKHSINHKRFTDKKLTEDFKKRLDEGLIARGLGMREESLNQREDSKDLSEIAYSDNPDRQSIYKAYMKYDTPTHTNDQKEDIRQRELEFIEAVKKDRQESAHKLSKTLQEYEDYKRAQQLKGQKEYEIVNDTPKETNKMTKRDWLAKLWSGTVTPEEFEEYMTHSSYGQDKRGMDQIVYEQNKYPGYGPKKFITSEDEVRLCNELLEQHRRTAVMDGRVSEAESFQVSVFPTHFPFFY